MAGRAATLQVAEVAVRGLAEGLVDTQPYTVDHWNAWAAYRLGIAVRAEMETEQGGPVTCDDINAAYLRVLAEAAENLHAAVMIPPLNWDLAQWRRDARLGCSAIRPVTGTAAQWKGATWPAILEGLAMGAATVYDRRASEGRFARYAAFRLLD